MTSCLFDRIIDGTLPGEIVLDEPRFVGFLDIHPLFPGHTLVVPRDHVGTLAELDEDLVGDLFRTGRRVDAALRRAFGAEGAFLALNDEVSQSVAHVHLHVVPRRRGDGLRGFFWPRTRYPDEAASRAVGDALRAALAEEAPS